MPVHRRQGRDPSLRGTFEKPEPWDRLTGNLGDRKYCQRLHYLQGQYHSKWRNYQPGQRYTTKYEISQHYQTRRLGHIQPLPWKPPPQIRKH